MRVRLAASLILLTLCAALPARAYTLFESDPVRPLALSPDGRHLAATNSPAGTVELFAVHPDALTPLGAIPVGLEPVALAWRDDGELWVVNHLSDSVSVVDVDPRALTPGRVIRTLHTGDEPRDIVFAGDRAFVTTAHRGQNAPDAQSTTPGVGRADVWVFDPDGERFTRGGTPAAIVTLFTDVPRALAVSPDGQTVYAAGFRTGNRTTALNDKNLIGDPRQPTPTVDAAGTAQLPTGLILQYDGAAWRDPLGRDWSDAVRFDLPDLDVFALDATAATPTVTQAWSGVGTVLFGMVADPVTGALYVSNTEAHNLTRFEGVGAHGSTVRGKLHTARVTVLDPDGAVTPRHLNPHIDYDACCEMLPNATNAASLATPMAPAITADGRTLYVPAYGSSALGVFDTTALRDGTFTPDPARQIALSGGGPAGVVLDEARRRAYVLTRFDNAVAVVDLDAALQIDTVPLPNPEPEYIRRGRPFLYDARLTSANGEASCASCHVFGDTDRLGWDLGDPAGATVDNPNPVAFFPLPFEPLFKYSVDFQALKGPMTTQSLRGMDNHGPMHWRGDRTGAANETSAQPDAGAYDERAAFAAFNGAFVSLVGRDRPLSESQMADFTEFALALTYPPNPIRRLDGRDTLMQARGRALYFGRITDTLSNCNGCHTLDPAGNAEYGVERPGFFGTDGKSTFDGIPQIMKVPHLRDAYQKVGMFGLPALEGVLPLQLDHDAHLGDQIRGFGYSHDGSIDTLYRFFSAAQFASREPGHLDCDDPGNPGLGLDLDGVFDRLALQDFVLAFPSRLAPIVGQQVTVDTRNLVLGGLRLALLVLRADAGDCDLVATAHVDGTAHGALYTGRDRFRLADGATLSTAATLWYAPVTYTCVPPGEGERYAYERR